MKVKKPKTDELVDALKQLKITDRRLRVSSHGRPFSSSVVGVSTDNSLRNRLTRSLSAVAPSLTHCLHHTPCRMSCSFTNTCPSTCELGSAVDRRLTESMINEATQISNTGSTYLNISSDHCPLTMSAGLLYSTLPFNKGKPATTSFTGINCTAGGLRRSFGAGLDQVHHNSRGRFTPIAVPCRKSCTNMTTISQGEAAQFDSVSAGPTSSHCVCCCHHCTTASVSRPTLPQLRLFRRLYSLIDHPCINLYRACRYSSCSHVAMSADQSACLGAGRTQPHHGHYRHSLGGSTSSASTHRNRPADIYCGVSVSSDIPPCCRSPFAVDFPNQACKLSHADDLIAAACDRPGLFGHRCRRNSDPEQWQPQLKPQTHPVELTGDANSAGTQAGTYGGRTFWSCRMNLGNQCTQTIDPQTAATHLFDCPQRSLCSADKYGGCHSSSAVGGQQIRRDCRSGPVSQPLLDNPPSSSTPHLCSLDTLAVNSAHLLRSLSNSGNSNRLDPPTRYPPESESSTFRFRAPILADRFNANTQVSDPGGGSGDCVFTATDLAKLQGLKSAGGGDAPSLWGLTETTYDHCDIKSSGVAYQDGLQSCQLLPGATRCNHHQQLEVVTADNDSLADDHSTTAMSMMTSDVSVSELAAYMEHMVHIPGRMSEMAQRMYI